MTLQGDIGKIIPGIQSLAVMGRALELIPKENNFLGKKPVKSKKLVKGSIDITISTALIKPVANIVSKL